MVLAARVTRASTSKDRPDAQDVLPVDCLLPRARPAFRRLRVGSCL